MRASIFAAVLGKLGLRVLTNLPYWLTVDAVIFFSKILLVTGRFIR